MVPVTTRRGFLKGIVATAVVLGFDPLTRSWVTIANAASAFDKVPKLDGELTTDAVSIETAADDFGHIVHRQPIAVLKPGSIKDIVRMVRFARAHGLKVAAQGQRHSTYGQAQVEAGLVIDMRTLATIHAIGPDQTVVDAGVLWSSLLLAALEHGSTPPVLTDYIELSIGGTLSVGGIGGTSHRYGLQVDNVLELEVVTGEGKHVTCSRSKHRELFEAVLAGLGQVGIIVRATLRLIPAETHARVFLLHYDDLATFTQDQRRLVIDERFDYVEGQVIPDPEGGWYYMLEAASFYTPPTVPINADLLEGLRYDRGPAQIDDRSYFDFANRLAGPVAFLKTIGVWYLPHPWFDVFVPGTAVVEYVGEVIADLTLEDTGQGPVLLYPVKPERFTLPLFRVPNEPVVFLFDILRTAGLPFTKSIAAMLASNRALFERVRELGGYRYPIGAITFTREDWKQHFGPVWDQLVRAKQEYDPDRVLTPGQGIFTDN